MVAIRVLGGVRLEQAATERLGPRHRLVLALLSARHGRSVDDETLIEAIWGEMPPKSARTALQTYVSELRDLLEPDRPRRSAGRFIHTDGTTYQLVCGPDDLDLASIEADLDGALSAVESVEVDAIDLAPGRSADEIAALLDRVLGRWGRPFGDLAEHERLLGVTARLEERYAAALETRAALALERGTGPELLDTLIEAVEAAPFRERLAAQLALVRYRTGDRTGALDELRALGRRLRDDLGLDPGPDITVLERAFLDHDVDRLEPAPASDEDDLVSPTRRRWSLAPMFGRDQAVSEVIAQLERWPIIALVGPGGIGKSTIARAVLDLQPDDCMLALVDLAELSDPTAATLLRSIANALGVAEQPGVSLAEAMVDAASLDDAVLVLDTAEVAPLVVDEVLTTLVQATKLRIVVTSQVSTSVPSVVEYGVEPLDDGSALQILGSGARVPDTPDDADVFAELAVRLGHLPLALEIAAARIRTHGASDTLQRLRDGEDLEVNSPSRPDRHRSSRAAAAWGISFLDDASRMLLQRLAVHVSSADLAVIRSTWVSNELDAAAIERAVDDLCRRSLLARVGSGDRITYRVPDPVRLAMRDQTSHDDRQSFIRRIAQVVLDTAQATMFGAPHELSLLQLEGEVPRAHDTLHQAGDMNELTLAGCCSLFWASRGRSLEGLGYMERALATHRAAPEMLYRPVAGITTFVAYASGDMRRTRELLDLFAAGADDGSTPVDMITLTVEASRAFIDLEYERAIDYFDQALTFYPNPTGPKLLLLWLAGNSRWYAGRHDDARAMYRLLRETATSVGDLHNESLALRFEAMVDAQHGEIERAWRLVERSMAIAQRLGDPGSLCQSEVAVAVVAHASDSLDEAEQHALEALRLTLRPFDLFTQRTGPPIIAAASIDRGDDERAAVAMGWHDHYLESTEQPATIAARRIADDAKRRLRQTLGPSGYARHAGRGAGMRLAQLHRFLST